MDSLITAAARALASGNPLDALNRVALRNDAPALALRGIAMAQLGDMKRAKLLLRRAARAFGARESMSRARCVVAEAEIALVSRELTWPARELKAARTTLERHGDTVNAAQARNLVIRRLLLIGRLDEAERAMAGWDSSNLPAALQATHELAVAGIALRRLRTKQARAALDRAGQAARRSGILALSIEVDNAKAVLQAPAARLIVDGAERPLLLEDVEALQDSKALLIDACRYAVRAGSTTVALVRRPVLFALIRVLGQAWPADVARDVLLARVFGARFVDESHRARLRVEIGRLRRLLRGMADISATRHGFVLKPKRARQVLILAQPVEEEHSAVLALLADGEAWSSSALALALDSSQRTVQRALDALAEAGKVQALGGGRARRWTTPPLPGIATTLLLPARLPGA
jgi:DNA-binding transcriptional ArsR family regulator